MIRFRRSVLLAALTALCVPFASILSNAARAGTWPEREVRIVVPWPAGGESDTYARALSQDLSAQLKQPVIIENRPGASGLIGTRAVLHGKADGYTFLFGNTTSHIGNVVFSAEPVLFDPLKDFTPVAIVVESAYVLWAHPSLGVKTFEEFLKRARAKESAPLAFGITGTGALSEISVEQLARIYKLNLTKVPYKGSAPQVYDLIAGHTQIGTASLATALGAYREGRLAPLLVIGNDRLPELPGVPTRKEIGVTDPDLTVWDGLFAPAGTPPEIVAAFTRAVGEAVKSAAYRTVADGNGHRAIFQSGAEATKRIETSLEARRRYKAQTENEK
ncbi:MAG: tripartite tricarboxylate transporter substrate binding protein [Zoogloeaceae bacterium]|jgi:tripartite-type tricarboxylate transporter receptor subunit TctC|nr:tripartite tricarboxylate transporter substrate binding protein [Zoogloeaceae bacterium]